MLTKIASPIKLQSLRIAVADDEAIVQRHYQEVLTQLGHAVVVTASTGRELIDQCRIALPDLIITDVRMPDLDGIDAVREITRDCAVPVIVVSAFHDPELIDRASADYVMAFLVKPIKRSDLEPAIVVAMKRFHQLRTIQSEAQSLSRALQDRKIIERAKGLLMKQAGLDEETSFRRLQKLARDRNVTVAHIAQIVLNAEEMIEGAGRKRQ